MCRYMLQKKSVCERIVWPYQLPSLLCYFGQTMICCGLFVTESYSLMLNAYNTTIIDYKVIDLQARLDFGF